MSVRCLGDIVSRSGPCPSISESESILDLAATLSKRRVDAVAVLSSSHHALVGIATSRDVAKSIARGEHMQTTRVSQIMTAHPVTLPPTETPANALTLMREGRFRHIPVVASGTGTVLGIVGVLNLAYDAITRLQVSYSMIPSRRGFEFMRAARETMEKPTLRHIVDTSPVVTLTRESSVMEACEAFAREHLAAIVIVDDQGILDGIITCGDIVNRVIMKGLSPMTARVEDAMTANPDAAHPEFTILESMQRMQACNFRHLPVVEGHSRVVVGLVDVLQLASDTLSGLQTIGSHNAPRRSSHDDSANTVRTGSRGFMNFFSSLFSTSYAETPVPAEQPFQRMSSVPSRAVSFHASTNGPAPSVKSRRHFSYLGSESANANHNTIGQPDAPLASFKFMDINNEWRRIKMPMNAANGIFDHFMVNVRRRYAGSSLVGSLKVKYVDEDGDEVLISNDEDLASCFEDYSAMKKKTIQLKIYFHEKAASNHIQSPVSSAPSSALGSPHRPLSATHANLDEQVSPKGSEVESPPPGNSTDPVKVSRKPSKSAIPSASDLKATEAHRRMLDKQTEEAILLYDEALRLDSENARAQGGRGATRLCGGNSVGAEEDYRSAIALIEAGKSGEVGDYTFQMCVVGLVEALIDQRRYEEACAIANRIDPDSGNTGCVDAFRDELDVAGCAAQEALESGEFGDAMSCYTNALRVEAAYFNLKTDETPRSSLRLGRAKCYKALEDYDMALEDYEAAVKLEPDSVAAHKGCGKCLAELEQLDRALESYERAHKLDLADDEVSNEIRTIKSLLPDPLQTKREEIAKLGAVLGGLKLPVKAQKD